MKNLKAVRNNLADAVADVAEDVGGGVAGQEREFDVTFRRRRLPASDIFCQREPAADEALPRLLRRLLRLLAELGAGKGPPCFISGHRDR